MFRLAALKEGSELYKYLSSISSRTIYDAICDWMYSPGELEETYLLNFAGMPAGIRNIEYFKGISKYLKLKTPDKKYADWLSRYPHLPDPPKDTAAAMEFIWRKTERMKEKMLDPDQYYTFDLFEEYLFAIMITEMSSMEEVLAGQPDEGFPINELFGDKTPGGETDNKAGMDGEDFDEDQVKQAFADFLGDTVSRLKDIADKENEIEKTKMELIQKYGFDEEDADWTAEVVHNTAAMSLEDAEDTDHESLFFWDDDYNVFFAGSDTFIDAIHGITGGVGAVMGYGYENAAEIFTDAGYLLPLWLVGTETAYDIKKAALEERIRHMPEPDWMKGMFPDGPDRKDDENLPFS